MNNNQKPMADRLSAAMQQVCESKINLYVPSLNSDIDDVMSEACDYIRGLESVLEQRSLRAAGWAIFAKNGNPRFWSQDYTVARQNAERLDTYIFPMFIGKNPAMDRADPVINNPVTVPNELIMQAIELCKKQGNDALGMNLMAYVVIAEEPF